jgi:poly(3-hydroxybutyrate) depolymerase
MARLAFTALAALVMVGPVAGADAPPMQEVRVTSTLDGTRQPARLWAPETAKTEPRPLLVQLHSWSGDFTQDRSDWLREAVRREWICLQPDFRGRNDHPEACGSRLARQDILDAIDWVSGRFTVDDSRIYLAGVSGGGHMTMLMAGYHADRFSAVSAWVGISDLADWHRFHVKDGVPQNYARMIALCCGGAPGASAEVDAEYRARSPLTVLHQVGDLHVDLNAGVKDGKTGSVPIHHSLRAFNAIAGAGGHPLIAEVEMDELWRTERLAKAGPRDTEEDPTYGRAIRLRRRAGNARVTIFDGGHEGLTAAACAWLAQKSRPTKAGHAVEK